MSTCEPSDLRLWREANDWHVWSIDANGNYITNSGDKHEDHGTSVAKGTKICFTSAMNKEGEDCWQDPKLEVGQSGESVNDKGEKVMLKRVAYKPLTI